MKSSNKKHEKGQGLVEYALILVLVAIVVIGTLTILGPSIGNVFSSINNSITNAGGVAEEPAAACAGGIQCTPFGQSCTKNGGAVEMRADGLLYCNY